jgi:hypothetical protein
LAGRLRPRRADALVAWYGTAQVGERWPG